MVTALIVLASQLVVEYEHGVSVASCGVSDSRGKWGDVLVMSGEGRRDKDREWRYYFGQDFILHQVCLPAVMVLTVFVLRFLIRKTSYHCVGITNHVFTSTSPSLPSNMSGTTLLIFVGT
jgi:hypothetical protein